MEPEAWAAMIRFPSEEHATYLAETLRCVQAAPKLVEVRTAPLEPATTLAPSDEQANPVQFPDWFL